MEILKQQAVLVPSCRNLLGGGNVITNSRPSSGHE
jgi:hypothetical protein